jgi:hypothetical protein
MNLEIQGTERPLFDRKQTIGNLVPKISRKQSAMLGECLVNPEFQRTERSICNAEVGG